MTRAQLPQLRQLSSELVISQTDTFGTRSLQTQGTVTRSYKVVLLFVLKMVKFMKRRAVLKRLQRSGMTKLRRKTFSLITLLQTHLCLHETGQIHSTISKLFKAPYQLSLTMLRMHTHKTLLQLCLIVDSRSSLKYYLTFCNNNAVLRYLQNFIKLGFVCIPSPQKETNF